MERFCDGVGGIFKPRQIRRVAQAEADAEIIKVRNDFEKNRLIASLESGQTDVGRRAIARMIEQEVKHQLNMEEILGNAIENVLPTAKPEEIDSDFISTVFEKCKNVSSVELQSLWGKIIAQEANTPKSIGKKTLDIVANMDRADAELFTKFGACCFVLADVIPFATESVMQILDKVGVNFTALLHLDYLGLIVYNANGFLIGRTAVQPFEELYISGVEGMLVVRKNEPGEFQIACGSCTLTKAGTELLTICAAPVIEGLFDALIKDLLKDDRSVYSPYVTRPS